MNQVFLRRQKSQGRNWPMLNLNPGYLKNVLIIGALILLVNSNVYGQEQVNNIKTSKAVMDDFMDKRFGMFIHWGPVTLRGTEIGWSRGHEVSVNEYDNL